jgi:hypothetical protein
MYEACAVFQHNHASAGPSPELCTLFYRLIGLHKVACHVHFIFDGRDHPATKRGKWVKVTPHFLTRSFQELITAFGFTWHMVRLFVLSDTLSTAYLSLQAPREAEAELATMNQLIQIDAVFTSDSDAFVFDAQCVMCRHGNIQSLTICTLTIFQTALIQSPQLHVLKYALMMPYSME